MTMHTSDPAFLVHRLDVLLDEFEGREEDGVDDARSAHGDSKASVHVLLEELELGLRYWLALRLEKGVSLVYALGGIDGICSMCE
jgi:hypothetical protein